MMNPQSLPRRRFPLWVIGLASIIPGLGFALHGLFWQALVAAGVVIGLLVIFVVRLTWFSWYLFGLCWLVQMVWAATPEFPASPTAPLSTLPLKIPSPKWTLHMPKFVPRGQDFKKVAAKIQAQWPSFKQEAAIVIGWNPTHSEYQYVALTDKELIVIPCRPNGSLEASHKVDHQLIQWVWLEIGKRNSVLSLETQDQKHLIWHFPNKFLDQGLAIASAFPSNTFHATSFPIQTESEWMQFRSRTGLVVLVDLIIFGPLAWLLFTYGPAHLLGVSKDTALSWIGAVATLILGWPYWLELVRTADQDKPSHHQISNGVMGTAMMVAMWGLSLYLFGRPFIDKTVR
jgi:hypothetical protein